MKSGHRRRRAPKWNRNSRGGVRCAREFLKRIAALLLFTAVLFVTNVAWSHETLTTTVLFDREIVRILDRHCVMCHAEKGLAAPLVTYEQAWLAGRKIRAEVISRHMPPWAAFPGYGQFSNDNSLTLRETQFVISWVEGLGPRNSGTVFRNLTGGDAERPKEVRAHADFDLWHLGEPALKRPMPPLAVQPGQGNQVRRMTVDLGLTSPRKLRALEYKPGDRRIVRAAFFTLQETGQWIGSWTPWHEFSSLPKGVAYSLPAGAHVVAEIHYKSAPEMAVEQGTLGLFFADQAQSVSSDLVLEVKGNNEAKGANRLRAQTRLLADTSILALWPDVQPGITSIEVSARKPGGGTEILLFARDLPMDWPTPYILKQPVVLPKGTELAVTSYASGESAIRFTVTRARPTSLPSSPGTGQSR